VADQRLRAVKLAGRGGRSETRPVTLAGPHRPTEGTAGNAGGPPFMILKDLSTSATRILQDHASVVGGRGRSSRA
jgi:hypothetical protein